jgi:hypothetical protein
LSVRRPATIQRKDNSSHDKGGQNAIGQTQCVTTIGE